MAFFQGLLVFISGIVFDFAEYTRSFSTPHKKKSGDFKSVGLDGHSILPRRPTIFLQSFDLTIPKCLTHREAAHHLVESSTHFDLQLSTRIPFATSANNCHN